MYLFHDKVWAHKVNSISKLNDAAKHFTGVELDLVYLSEKKGFEVNHPPDPSLNLSLAKYLAEQSYNTSLNYWFDFKNLNNDNYIESSEILDSIIGSMKIDRKKIIIESVHPQFLGMLVSKGYRTSFYLPADLNKLSEDNLNSVLEEISYLTEMYPTTYISFDYKDYDIARKYFPEAKKISWFTVYGSMNKISARLILIKILMDDKADVLLLPFDSKNDSI